MDQKNIPYARQLVDDEDVAAAAAVLQGDWLTTGPEVGRFEAELAEYAGARHGVAVCNGTAALDCAMHALGIGPGDEVIVPAMTFVATANCVLYNGGLPVFADVDPDTLLMDPVHVESLVTPRTRAVLAVDYAGQPCDYAALRRITVRHGLALADDACHSLGASLEGSPVSALADVTVFSFHPVKHITTGEGGMIVTSDEALASAMRRHRNHGIDLDARQREGMGRYAYDMTSLGRNYRLTDFQSALGRSQLRKMPAWIARRRQLAARYDALLPGLAGVVSLGVRAGVGHAYHLYVVRIDPDACGVTRDDVFNGMREQGIGVNVHYLPTHLHTYYRERLGTAPGMCPVAERAGGQVLSLPMYPGLSDAQQDRVVEILAAVLARSGASK